MKVQYQVMVKGSSEIHNFEKKTEALQCVKDLKAQGKDAYLWDVDVLDNPLSRVFDSIFSKGK